MGSAIYRVHTFPATGNSFEVKLEIIHIDQSFIECTPNIGLQILCDLYEYTKRSYSLESGTLPADSAQRLQKAGVAEVFQEMLNLSQGTEFQVSEEVASQYPAGSEYMGKSVWLTYEGKPYWTIHTEPEYEAFCHLAEKEIQSVEILEYAPTFPWQKDRISNWIHGIQEAISDENPVARLRISVHRPELLCLLTDAYSWETAMFDFEIEAPEFEPTPRKLGPLLDPNRNIQPDAPIVLQKWWNELPVFWQKILWWNLRLQKQALIPAIAYHFIGSGWMGLKTELESLQVPVLTDSDLQELQQMQLLIVSFLELTDLEPIRNLKGLTVLVADGNLLTDIQVLAEMKQLQYLMLWNNSEIEDFSPLASLTELRQLYYYAGNSKNFALISNLTKLKVLEIGLYEEYDWKEALLLPELKKLQGYAFASTPEAFSVLKSRGIEVDVEIIEEEE